jgi:hypothetical protein
MAWIDLGLRLVERLLTPAVMLQTARMFLVDPAGREQSHYAPHTPATGHGDASVLGSRTTCTPALSPASRAGDSRDADRPTSSRSCPCPAKARASETPSPSPAPAMARSGRVFIQGSPRAME